MSFFTNSLSFLQKENDLSATAALLVTSKKLMNSSIPPYIIMNKHGNFTLDPTATFNTDRRSHFLKLLVMGSSWSAQFATKFQLQEMFSNANWANSVVEFFEFMLTKTRYFASQLQVFDYQGSKFKSSLHPDNSFSKMIFNMQFTHLTDLNVSECDDLLDEDFAHIVGLKRSLVKLNISRNPKITNKTLEYIGQLVDKEPKKKNKNTTDDSNHHIIYTSSSPFRSLDIKDCDEFTDHGLSKLQHMTDNLEFLSLSSYEFTNQGFEFLRRLENLQFVDVTGNKNVREKGIEYLGDLPNLMTIRASAAQNKIIMEKKEADSQKFQKLENVIVA